MEWKIYKVAQIIQKNHFSQSVLFATLIHRGKEKVLYDKQDSSIFRKKYFS